MWLQASSSLCVLVIASRCRGPVFVFFLLTPRLPRSTLFPYTTLFRSLLPCRSSPGSGLVRGISRVPRASGRHRAAAVHAARAREPRRFLADPPAPVGGRGPAADHPFSYLPRARIAGTFPTSVMVCDLM